MQDVEIVSVVVVQTATLNVLQAVKDVKMVVIQHAQGPVQVIAAVIVVVVAVVHVEGTAVVPVALVIQVVTVLVKLVVIQIVLEAVIKNVLEAVEIHVRLLVGLDVKIHVTQVATLGVNQAVKVLAIQSAQDVKALVILVACLIQGVMEVVNAYGIIIVKLKIKTENP